MHEKAYLQAPCLCQACASVQKSTSITAIAYAVNVEVLQLMISSLSSLMAYDQIQLMLLSQTRTDETSGIKIPLPTALFQFGQILFQHLIKI